MELRHFRHWPPDLPRSLRAPSITLHEAFLRSARKLPGKRAAVFEGRSLSYQALQGQIEDLAGYLQNVCGVKPRDRVLLERIGKSIHPRLRRAA